MRSWIYELYVIFNKIHKVQVKNKVQKVRTSQLCVKYSPLWSSKLVFDCGVNAKQYGYRLLQMNPRDDIVLKREVDDQDRRNKLAVDRRKYCQLGWLTTGSVYLAKRRPLSSQVDNIVATIDVPWRNFLSLEFRTKYLHFCRYRNFLSTRRKPACQKTSSIRTKGSTERRLVTNTRQTHTLTNTSHRAATENARRP